MQKVFLGNFSSDKIIPDLSLREKIIMVPLVIAIVWLGVFPQPVMNAVKQVISAQFNTEQIISNDTEKENGSK